MNGLTTKQAKLLSHIRRMTVDDVPPSFNELAAAMGLKSRGGIHRHLACLRERGAIDYIYGRARSIVVLDEAADDLPQRSTESLRALLFRVQEELRRRAQ